MDTLLIRTKIIPLHMADIDPDIAFALRIFWLSLFFKTHWRLCIDNLTHVNALQPLVLEHVSLQAFRPPLKLSIALIKLSAVYSYPNS